MDAPQQQAPPQPGALHWRLSSHPITLLTFLAFRIGSLLVYLFGLLFTGNKCVPPSPFPPLCRVLVFIITVLLLAADFYYLKNIAGRRLVGLRWWNEVNPETGDSKWVFESSDPASNRVPNATDSRFFWLAIYAQPLSWTALAVFALFRFSVLWLPLLAIALALTVTNALAFSRCDKFSQASNLAGSAFSSTNLAGSIASGMASRFFGR
ncbi:golgi family apparatus membrane protein tvp23 [Sporothrix schenckii 1099-18]|uniref:Golgi apparatus membrane protein TVP23 n=1 Tax=Sporothrix schenckii 1099-18 TaxID=1397361 RepID=A0A0F2LW38_SPOSC|nr:golgi family apparatus membrane protein tvp23 [Sporothrix schenckii 1099-18]KJR81687.1 golgi family apparatus membrane protein tvp23 [Sporothrix schenckii 1099-18]